MNSNNLSRTIENEHNAKKVEVSKRINSISTRFFEESNQSISSSLKEHIELLEEINKTLPPYKYIKNMIITDKPLIKTTTHKIKRKEELALIEGK